jgi:hypothetical protein
VFLAGWREPLAVSKRAKVLTPVLAGWRITLAAVIDMEQLEPVWEAALAHAGYEVGAALLYPFEGARASDGSGAVHFPPGHEIGEADQMDHEGYIRVANEPKNRDLHRIALWTGVDPPVLAGRLRHELEHARQWDRFGQPIFDLYDLLLREVLPAKAGGLDGCLGMYFNAIPAEQDANAAAAIFVHDQQGDDAIAALCRDPDYRNLGCSLLGAQPLDTLPARMVAFAFTHRDCCELVAKSYDGDFAEVLDNRFEGAGDLWRRLEGTV